MWLDVFNTFIPENKFYRDIINIIDEYNKIIDERNEKVKR